MPLNNRMNQISTWERTRHQRWQLDQPTVRTVVSQEEQATPRTPLLQSMSSMNEKNSLCEVRMIASEHLLDCLFRLFAHSGYSPRKCN
jgi:hypothetical protein